MHSGSSSSDSNSGAVASSSRDHAVQLLEQRLAAIVEDLIRRRLREVLASMSPTELADVLHMGTLPLGSDGNEVAAAP